jgi:hypothetical protein
MIVKTESVTQTGIKLGLGIYRQISCYEALSQHTTAELHLPRLIGMVSHLQMQIIWIIGFFLENRPHWQFEVEKNFYKRLF